MNKLNEELSWWVALSAIIKSSNGKRVWGHWRNVAREGLTEKSAPQWESGGGEASSQDRQFARPFSPYSSIQSLSFCIQFGPCNWPVLAASTSSLALWLRIPFTQWQAPVRTRENQAKWGEAIASPRSLCAGSLCRLHPTPAGDLLLTEGGKKQLHALLFRFGFCLILSQDLAV